MPSFIIVNFIIGRDSIPNVFHNLIDDLNTAVSKSDFSNIRETLQDAGNRLKEMLPRISSDKVREFISKTIYDIAELIKKLTSNQGGLNDVRSFIDSAKDGLKQRMTDKIKEMSA